MFSLNIYRSRICLWIASLELYFLSRARSTLSSQGSESRYCLSLRGILVGDSRVVLKRVMGNVRSCHYLLCEISRGEVILTIQPTKRVSFRTVRRERYLKWMIISLVSRARGPDVKPATITQIISTGTRMLKFVVRNCLEVKWYFPWQWGWGYYIAGGNLRNN